MKLLMTSLAFLVTAQVFAAEPYTKNASDTIEIVINKMTQDSCETTRYLLKEKLDKSGRIVIRSSACAGSHGGYFATIAYLKY